MRKRVFQWLGREFISLSAEGKAGMGAAGEARDLLERFDGELRGTGLSLENTVRTRLWARDGESRSLASAERLKALTGKARSASASFIAPDRFDSEAQVALALIAMRPPQPDAQKVLKEFDPPAAPLRYLISDSLVFLSGVTAGTGALADQVAEVLPLIGGSLTDAGSSWDRAVKVSCFLQRDQDLEALKELLRDAGIASPGTDYTFVDSYAAEGRLIEIEVTAETSA
jgi:enamine deaminase RidA (YjgF/YER057c/UK114 family)